MSLLTEVVLYIDVGVYGRAMREALALPVDPHSGQRFEKLNAHGQRAEARSFAAMSTQVLQLVGPEDVAEFVRGLPWGHGKGVLVIDYEHEDDLIVTPWATRCSRANSGAA